MSVTAPLYRLRHPRGYGGVCSRLA